MRNVECQVAAVVAVFPMAVAVFGPLLLAGSGQQALRDLARPRADSDQVPASARLVRGLPAFHLLLHRTGPSHRGLFHPVGTSL